jgi:hypothetical protein
MAYKNPVDKKAWRKAYYAKNKDKIKAQATGWRKANSEKSAAYTRNRDLQRKYGLSVAGFDEMLAAQNNRCALCSTDAPGGKGTFHVDHCHDTGRVRGLLCMSCNVGIGQLKHSPELLQRAIEYLD